MYFEINSNIPLIHLYARPTSGNSTFQNRDSKGKKKASEEGSSFKANELYSLNRDPSSPGNGEQNNVASSSRNES